MSMRIWTPKSFFQISVSVHVVGVETARSEERNTRVPSVTGEFDAKLPYSAVVALVRRGDDRRALPQQSSR